MINTGVSFTISIKSFFTINVYWILICCPTHTISFTWCISNYDVIYFFYFLQSSSEYLM